MENLPNELLIKIFEYLSTTDHLEIATVSRHWFEILQLPQFTKHYHILLEHCTIDKKYPPFKTFCTEKRSHRTFPCLTLGIKFVHNNLADVESLLNELGKDVHHLRIWSCYTVRPLTTVIKFFPNLTTLTLDDDLQHHNLEGPFPESLQTLIVKSFGRYFDPGLLKKIPNLKTVLEGNLSFFSLKNNTVEGFTQASERLKYSLAFLEESEGYPTMIKTNMNYIGTQEIDVEHVIHLSCSGTKEKLRFIGSEYVGLKSLQFYIEYSSDDTGQCFFGHDVIEGFSRLNSLVLIKPSFQEEEFCDTCFETFLDTFKNVLELTMPTLNPKHYNLIFSKLEKLQKVSLSSSDLKNEVLIEFDAESLPNLVELSLSSWHKMTCDESWKKWPSMPNLRNLSISFFVENIQRATWIRIFQQCPSLVQFTYDRSNCINDTILVHITKLLPKLQHLILPRTDNLTQISFDSICDNCHSLKTLRLGSNRVDTELDNFLFTNLKRLKYFEWISTGWIQVRTRADFYVANSSTKATKKCKRNANHGEEENESSSSDDEAKQEDKKPKLK